MSAMRLFDCLVAIALSLGIHSQAQPSGNVSRQIALTFDDLPGVPAKSSVDDLSDMNRRLLGVLRISGAPAIGSVNEKGVDVDREREARTALLRAWLDAGMTLGNHGYAHHGLNDTPLADYEVDLLRGGQITRTLLESRGRPLVWYRHPFNQTGPTAEIRAAFEQFARAHGYRIAPFTIEATDYAFASCYERALADKNSKRADAVMAAYLEHLDAKVAWGEAFSGETFGHEIPQILLSHVNRLNADAMPEMLRRLRARGCRFITLGQAVADAAYQTPDDYVGKNGPSWLHRWRVSLRLPPRLVGEPDPPDWVLSK